MLELGAGYCDFINNITARRKFAVDIWPGMKQCANKDVEAVVSDVTQLSWLPEGQVDFAFASNLFEHLPQPQFASVLASLRSALSPDGKLCILQPNFRYCSSRYFDDYTHVSIYSHVSLCDFLKANGFDVLFCHPRFMPFSIKSGSMPVNSFLIRMYLRMPFRPLGAQMLVVCRVRGTGDEPDAGR